MKNPMIPLRGLAAQVSWDDPKGLSSALRWAAGLHIARTTFTAHSRSVNRGLGLKEYYQADFHDGSVGEARHANGGP